MRIINAYKIGFVVLVIANIILALLFFLKPERPPLRRDAQASLMEKISKQLALTDEQQAQYFKLAQRHRDAMAALNNEQKGLITYYFDHLTLAQPDSVDIANTKAQLQSLEGRKLSLTYNHFEELKALCNEDQKAQFELIMGEVVAVLIGAPKKLPPPPRDQ